MKKLLFILALALISCTKDDETPDVIIAPEKECNCETLKQYRRFSEISDGSIPIDDNEPWQTSSRVPEPYIKDCKEDGKITYTNQQTSSNFLTQRRHIIKCEIKKDN